ncbi:MAG: exo-alpha-sialidase [Hyphomicrobiales bacterium]|nr:MAG: exo-alpha-sialidase [Hyphomicrobiales bacterium]
MRIVASGYLGRAEPGTGRANLTFPMALSLADGTLIATLRSGPDKDSAADSIELYRSTDNGATWTGPDYPFVAPDLDGVGGSLKICYLTELRPGRLIAAAMWIDRTTYPGQPLFNAETEGCLPMSILVADSVDNGASWSDWRHIPMPDWIGPASLTSPLLKLSDGRLAMSIETNKPYLDRSKWQQRAVYFHSSDDGQSWSAPVTVAEDSTGRIFNWDLRAAVAPDGRVASFAWTYDSQTSTYLDIHRRISSDGGMSWTSPEPIGVSDQAARPAIRKDGSMVLAWVDRFGTKSIRARYAPAIDAPFDPASEVVIYTHGAGEAASADTGDMLASMDLWSFGLPFAEVLPNGEVLVFYYAGEPKALDVRWARLAV